MTLNAENRQRVLLIVAAACVGLLALDRLVVGPYAAAWRDRAERLATLSLQVERGQALLDRAEAIQQRWENLQRDSLPADRPRAEELVLRAAAGWAREARVVFTSLNPQWRDGERDSALFECRAGLSGDLQQLARFLHALETDPLPVRIEEFRLAADDDQGRRLTLNLRFSGLQLNRPANSASTTP
ncbi:MAG: hypothetical protein D6766_12840 [Verrucomicrobia bacterium]|nr:MAG: hypothetical protein D6766_12840 [Verrucomicrobiota bacterium]